jgi:FG-GAP repeat
MKKLILLFIIMNLIHNNYNGQTTGVKSYYKVSDGTGGFPTGLLGNSDRYGSDSQGIGDLDGDGIPDLAVGAVLDDDGFTDAGAVWILFLNLDGSVKSYKKIANNTNGFGNELGAADVFGNAIESVGDLDGDGIIDLAVGAMYDDDGGSARGAIYILFMNTDGTVSTYQKISDTSGGFGGTLATYDFFGTSIANLGDLDGDGINDLAVGAFGDDDGGSGRGAVWILFMNVDGTVKSEIEISDGNGGFPTDSLDNDDRFGFGVETIGDLDSDGVIDIIVGAIYDDDGNTNAGALWVLFLNSDGTVKATQKISSTAGDLNITMDAADIFGMYTQYMGDSNGDGDINIMVAARNDDDGGTNKGAFYILDLGTDGKVNSSEKISDTSANFSSQLDNGDRFGSSLSMIGDLNNDGIVEYGVGSILDDDGGTDRGAIYEMTFNGPTTLLPLTKSDVKLSDTQGSFTGTLDNSDWFGYASEGIGDLDGDGVEDIAVNAYQDDDGNTNSGAIWILFLNTDGTVKSHQKISNTDGGLGNILHYNEYFGNAIENIGDLDGDGVTDIAVGAMNSNNAGTVKGAVYILFLNKDGTVKSSSEITQSVGGFTGPLDVYDLFGTSIANIGDIDGDGIIDLAVGTYGDDDGGSARGAVWILFMDDDGSVQSEQKISDGTGGFPTGVLSNDDRFGYGVEAVGDLDLDGVTDIVVGAILDDDGNTNSGALWVLFLDTNGTVKSNQKISATAGNFNGVLDASDVIGVSNQYIGDIDGDGYVNLLVSARNDDDGGTNRGAVWILNLNTDGTVKDYQKISNNQAGFYGNLGDSDWFGASVSLVGDLDNDGLLEFAIGASTDDDGGTDRGAIYMLTLNKNFFTTYVPTHVKLKKQLDGGYYSMYNKEIRFQYNEEYEIGDFRKLAYSIYDNEHNVVGGVDLEGNSLVTGSELLDNSVGENNYELGMSNLSLTINEYYTLEVFNDKNEKKVLKFKVYN